LGIGGGHTLGRLWERYLARRNELARLSPDDPARLGLRRQVNRLKERLMVNYSPLVKYVTGRMPAGIKGTVETEELVSWGQVGLLDAIETFDPERQTKFETYAISKIRWAMLDEFRRQDWVPRRVRSQIKDAELVTSRLAQNLRRNPTELEVAGEMNLPLDEYRNLLGWYTRSRIYSLEARMEMSERLGGELHGMISDLGAADPQSEANRTDLRRHLAEAISELGEQERVVATFYFYEGLTLREIGRALSLSEGRISQILRQALIKLRSKLEENR